MFDLLKYIIIVSILLFFFSCASSSRLKKARNDSRDISFLYNPSAWALHPEYKIYHNEEETSVLMIRLFSDELLYNKVEPSIYIAKLQLEYQMYFINDSGNSTEMADSASRLYELELDETSGNFSTSLKIKALAGKKYLLTIKLVDLLSNKNSFHSLVVDKTNKSTRQNFNVVSVNNGKPFFRTYLQPNTVFHVQSKRNQGDSIHVKYYKKQDPETSFIFNNSSPVLVKTRPDTVFCHAWKDSTRFILPDEGIYHFQLNKDSTDGLTLFRFSHNYPQVKTVHEMIGPLLYLTNSAQYQNILEKNNRKLALDNYWLHLSENMDKAKELIRVYYNRVRFANYYFASDKEGWKTDRGMIYIIFGPPKHLHAENNREKWVYLDKNRGQTVNFIFGKRKNPFTTNDYILDKNERVSAYWQRATQSWTNGKIYSFGE